MDKRIVLSMVIVFISSVAIAAYRKFFYRHDGIHATISPRDAVLHVGDSISYRDATDGANRRIWDFGDGEFSTSETGRHTYLTPGKFRVRLHSHGVFGTLVDSSMEVVVLGNEPAMPAGISGPAMAIVGESVKYEAPGTAESYEWRVEGDASLASARQRGSAATYQFSNPGKKTLIVATRNPDQNFRKDIVVQAPASTPIVSATPPRPAPAAEKPRNNPAPRPRPARPSGGSQPLPDIGQGVIIDD